jgi:hypothetical protein
MFMVRDMYLAIIIVMVHVKWVTCHHSMARPQVADGDEGLQIWRVAANILNKQSRTADRGWPSSLGVGHRANNPPTVKSLICYETGTSLGRGHQDRDSWQAVVNVVMNHRLLAPQS